MVLIRHSIEVIILSIMVSHPFQITYDPGVKDHLRSIERKYYSLITDKIEEQLRYQPDFETRNRKPLDGPPLFGADWELRFGPGNRFRVLYRIDVENHEVEILAIGVKEKERLYVAGEEV
jgi:mRNA-degrading endonuclease RelE of RelBE toxin-antitoxin system